MTGEQHYILGQEPLKSYPGMVGDYMSIRKKLEGPFTRQDVEKLFELQGKTQSEAANNFDTLVAIKSIVPITK
jgi:hypothetical protein